MDGTTKKKSTLTHTHHTAFLLSSNRKRRFIITQIYFSLYAKGRVLGFKRAKRNQRPDISLIQIEGVKTAADTDFYLGKRVAFVYRAKREVNGSKIRCIWGRVTRAHGGSGVVKARFRHNLPAKSFGASVRVNNQLGSFMKSIYGPNYHVQNPKRTLPYSSSFRGLSYPTEIRCILDPNHSAVCIELQLENDHQCPEIIKVANDSRATAVVEATFVTGIIECYLEMVGPDTATSLFVAVPHHIQRLAILHRVKLPALEAKYPHAMIKIDTIEKMQGQEADLVVVCFVLFDDFTLVNELSYLYSVHRWIVALSRARCKTVLLMTPQLKAPRIMNGSAKANPKDLETLDGWGLLQAFEKYSISLGGKLVWPISKEFLKNIEL
ncbi:hypothetical protein BX616_005090 [Lobosporangium transversale]|nr:hypothetical protein BX616_005090 [Lobosporangium transversale]